VAGAGGARPGPRRRQHRPSRRCSHPASESAIPTHRPSHRRPVVSRQQTASAANARVSGRSGDRPRCREASGAAARTRLISRIEDSGPPRPPTPLGLRSRDRPGRDAEIGRTLAAAGRSASRADQPLSPAAPAM